MPSTLQAPQDAFTVTTDEADGFHYVVDTATGEILPRAYPLRKTANRAARVMCERADANSAKWVADNLPNLVEDIAKALGISPTRATDPDGPNHLDDPEPEGEAWPPEGDDIDEPTQIDVEDIAPTVQPAPAPKAEAIRHPVADVIATREDWLGAAAVLISAVLADLADIELPSYRVTCGWPSKSGTSKKNRRIGECWNAAASDDAHAEVFISPMEADALTVVAILAHELIHAGLPVGTGHKGPFVKAAKAIGFLKPFTQLKTSDALNAWAQDIVNALPAYPHARLNPAAEGEKKTQTTRMIKAVCEEIYDGETCGYQVRLTRKWIDSVGAPICPRCNERMACEGVDLGGGDEPEGEGED